MNQHTFVRERFTFYEEQGLIPGNPDDGEWDECHYPDPRDVGSKIVLMLHNDHQQQGLYQSEEYGRPCFFNGDVKRFLDNNWCPNWFDLYDLYEKWSGYYGEVNATTNLLPNCSANGKANGKGSISRMPVEILVANTAAMLAHENTRKQQKANGMASMASMPKESMVAGGKNSTSQRWQCLVTGYVSNPGGLSAYQKARGIDTALRKQLGYK
jgi:hypothetical protein